MTIDFLTFEDVHQIHEIQLIRFGGGAGLRDVGLLESAIAQPQNSFGGEYLHPVPRHLGWFFPERVPDGPGVVHSLDLHVRQPVYLGARAVLWLAMPLWRTAGDGGLAG